MAHHQRWASPGALPSRPAGQATGSWPPRNHVHDPEVSPAMMEHLSGLFSALDRADATGAGENEPLPVTDGRVDRLNQSNALARELLRSCDHNLTAPTGETELVQQFDRSPDNVSLIEAARARREANTAALNLQRRQRRAQQRERATTQPETFSSTRPSQVEVNGQALAYSGIGDHQDANFIANAHGGGVFWPCSASAALSSQEALAREMAEYETTSPETSCTGWSRLSRDTTTLGPALLDPVQRVRKPPEHSEHSMYSFGSRTTKSFYSLRGESMDSDLNTGTRRQRTVREEKRSRRNQAIRERRHRWLQEAEDARTAYGPSRVEIREQERKEAKVAQLTQSVRTEEGMYRFMRRFPWVIVLSLLFIGLEYASIFERLQSPSPNFDVTEGVFENAVWGIAGACCHLFVVVLVGTHFMKVHFSRSRHHAGYELPYKLANAVMITLHIGMYLMILQGFSNIFFNYVYLGQCFRDKAGRIPAVLNYVATIIAAAKPFVALLLVYHSFQMVVCDISLLTNVKTSRLVFSRSVAVQLSLSALFALFYGLEPVWQLLFVIGVPKVTFNMGVLFAAPVTGLIAIVNSALFHKTLTSFYHYLDLLIERQKIAQDMTSVGSRVLLLPSTRCKLQHLVDHRWCNGMLGTLTTAVPDANGRYEVELDAMHLSGRKHQSGRPTSYSVWAEEFQLGLANKSDEELKAQSEENALHYADFVRKSEWRQFISSQSFRALMFSTLLIASLCEFVIIYFFQNGGANLAASVFLAWVFPDAGAGVSRPDDYSRLMKVQDQLCDLWERCTLSNPDRPDYCGSCVVDELPGVNITFTARGSIWYDQGWVTTTIILTIVFGVVGMVIGLCIGCSLGHRRFLVVFVISFGACFAAVGTSVGPLSFNVQDDVSIQTIDGDDFCSVHSLDMNVSLFCLFESGAYFVDSHFRDDFMIDVVPAFLALLITHLYAILSVADALENVNIRNELARHLCMVSLFMTVASLIARVVIAIMSYDTDVRSRTLPSEPTPDPCLLMIGDVLPQFVNAARVWGLTTYNLTNVFAASDNPGMAATELNEALLQHGGIAAAIAHVAYPVVLSVQNYKTVLRDLSFAFNPASNTDLYLQITSYYEALLLPVAVFGLVALIQPVHCYGCGIFSWCIKKLDRNAYRGDDHADGGPFHWTNRMRYILLFTNIIPIVIIVPHRVLITAVESSGNVGFLIELVTLLWLTVAVLAVFAALRGDIYPEVFSNAPKIVYLKVLYYLGYIVPLVCCTTFALGFAGLLWDLRNPGSQLGYMRRGVGFNALLMIFSSLVFFVWLLIMCCMTERRGSKPWAFLAWEIQALFSTSTHLMDDIDASVNDTIDGVRVATILASERVTDAFSAQAGVPAESSSDVRSSQASRAAADAYPVNAV